MIVTIRKTVELETLLTPDEWLEIHKINEGANYGPWLVQFMKGHNDGSGYQTNCLFGAYGKTIEEALAKATERKLSK